jgi:hypothetical protein
MVDTSRRIGSRYCTSIEALPITAEQTPFAIAFVRVASFVVPVLSKPGRLRSPG